MGVRAAIIWVGLTVGSAASVAVADDPAAPSEPLASPRTSLQPPVGGRLDSPISQPPVDTGVILPDGSRVTLPAVSRQLIQFKPRYKKLPSYNLVPVDDSTDRVLWTDGIIVNVVYYGAPGSPPQEIEFACDTVVAWIKGAKGQNIAAGIEVDPNKGKSQVELYLAGDVVIRSLNPSGPGGPVEQVLRAEEIYYDVSQNRCVALCADLEMRGDAIKDGVHLKAPEVWRLGRNEWRAFDALTYSSKRPSDPNLTLRAKESRLVQRYKARTNVFGIPYRKAGTGEEDVGYERILTNTNATVRILDIPVLYWPKLRSDLSEPFGPLMALGLGNDRIFGAQVYTDWDLYKTIGVRAPQGHRWWADVDYLGDRGLALGTQYIYSGLDLFGFGNAHNGHIKLYGLKDNAAQDTLGGFRGDQPAKPDYRGRAQWRHNQDLYEDGTTYLRTMGQLSYLSDKNFLEQFYKIEFDQDPNQETFRYSTGAINNLFGSLLLETRSHRDWVTETNWLPRGDGALLGKTFFDNRIVYSARGSAGYYQFRPTSVLPPPVLATDQAAVEGGRFDLNQRVSAPFDLGPVRLDPYGVVDLTHYTQDATGQERGRFYGGGGASASTTLSRLYPDAASELFNVRGLNHKVTFGADYFASYSDTPYTRLPQLDRVFDDAMDQGYRNFRPIQSQLVPGAGGLALQTSPLFDPQQYTIRRLVENKVDTLDGLQVLQMGVQQRLQTKRGIPGSEHTVDWMTLNLSASYFPDPQKDNYGTSWSFLEYQYLWHVGDRFSVSSAGWFDPIENGARYYNVGFNFNRPDGTNFYVSYRHTDPLDSRAVLGTITYQLSQKYSMNLGASYDFGINEALTNTFSVSRTGTDMTMLFGFTYNALVNNFGVQFALVPNLMPLTAGARPFGGSSFTGR